MCVCGGGGGGGGGDTREKRGKKKGLHANGEWSALEWQQMKENRSISLNVRSKENIKVVSRSLLEVWELLHYRVHTMRICLQNIPKGCSQLSAPNTVLHISISPPSLLAAWREEEEEEEEVGDEYTNGGCDKRGRPQERERESEKIHATCI